MCSLIPRNGMIGVKPRPTWGEYRHVLGGLHLYHRVNPELFGHHLPSI